VRAALLVAAAAIPLSLGISIATDAPADLGLTTAAIAGVVHALFGGSRVGVTGPAAILAVLIGQIVDRQGIGALPIVAVLAGAIQIAIGVLGLGRIARLVPASIVQGFTSGVGITLLVGQLPRALGLEPTDESHVLDVLVSLPRSLGHASPVAIGVALFAALLTWRGPRLWRKAPWSLLAIAVPSLGLALAGTALPLLGPVARPLSAFPHFAWPRDVSDLLLDTLAFVALGSVSAVARANELDRERPTEPAHDADQELIGQGLANLAVAAVGGLPVTRVTQRSRLLAAAGGFTRRAEALSALILLALSWAFVPFFAWIPVAALAGVVMGVALDMIAVGALVELVRSGARGDAFAFATTVVVMVGFDVGLGVQAGVVVALALSLSRVARGRAELEEGTGGVPHHASLSGSLTFLAVDRIESLGRRLARLAPEPGVVLDLREVDGADADAVGALADVVALLHARGSKVALLGARTDVAAQVRASAPSLAPLLTAREADLDKVLDRSRVAHGKSQLLSGVRRFAQQHRGDLAPLLGELAAGQAPHTLMLTCADSRVVPSLLTGTQPGELFVVRNIGALLPPHGHDTLNDEGAALEYAIRVLGVRNVVVCAHARCGAMGALKKGGIPAELRALAHWAEGAKHIAAAPVAEESVDDFAKASARRQLEHLRSYPVVQEALAQGELSVAAWFYDVERADVLEWSDDVGRWVALGEPLGRLSLAPMLAASTAHDHAHDAPAPEVDPAHADDEPAHAPPGSAS
jgi:carbonic anhydrase